MKQRSVGAPPRLLWSGLTSIFVVVLLTVANPFIGLSMSAQTGMVVNRTMPNAGRFAFSAGAGIMTSGDLFKVEVVNRTPHQWLTPAGQLFNSEEFVVTLDEDMFVGAALSYRVTGMWWLRADLSYSKVDATAEALVGESVELFLYDRLAFLMAGLVVERPLVATPSYPFLLAGVAWVKLTAEHASELDQDGLGIRFGAGYNHNFGGLWCLRFEIRDTVKQIDTLAHQPTTTEPIEVDTNYTEAGPQNLFEISLMVRGRFH